MYNLKDQKKSFDIPQRTFSFGVRIVKLVLALPKQAAVSAIGHQLIRSGTSVGANTEEAQNAGSKKEFIYSMTIALKEARETEYWLRIICETELLEKHRLRLLLEEINEIIRILTTIVKNSKKNSVK